MVYTLKNFGNVVMFFSYFLESIRTNFLDNFFLLITEFGGETITYIFLFAVIWCMDIDFSRFFVIVNFYSIGTNIFLKNLFCVPRPWILDPNFTVVEGAIEGATGYSFPSGHTATAVSVFGSFTTRFRSILIRCVLITLIVLVSISRIYLGVHTIWDVLASLVLGTIIILSINIFLNYTNIHDKYLYLISFACFYSLIIVIVLNCLPVLTGYSAEMTTQGIKNAYTILGLSFGYLVSYIINYRYETSASFAIQLIKVIFGAVFVLVLKEGLKYLFDLVLPDLMFTSAIRYFIVVLFAVNIWPLTFKWFNKIEYNFRSIKNAKS